MNKFKSDTIVHKNDIKGIMTTIVDILLDRSENHDNDKMDFDDLKDWMEYFNAKHHFEGRYGNTHHHKQDVDDLFGVIEMYIDWCSASYRRRGEVLNPVTQCMPNLNWDKIAINTLSIIVQYSKAYFSDENMEETDTYVSK